jgi:hypothetical protein
MLRAFRESVRPDQFIQVHEILVNAQ